MNALILDAEARTANIKEIALPQPAADELLVKVESISLNPIDPLYVVHPLGKTGRTVGSDFAGHVVGIGSQVPESASLQRSDRVAGFLQGACSINERPGAFSEYLTIPWDLVWRIPDIVSSDEAAGVSLVALTAAQGIWYRMGLLAPFEYDREAVLKENLGWRQSDSSDGDEPGTINVLIYSASTSVGLYAAQMARLSAKASGKKIKLFGTASKIRWEFLKAEPYAYDHLVDYRDKDWPQQIKTMSEGAGMNYAYDGLSEGESVARVASTLADNGKMAIVRSREGGAWKASDLPIEPTYGAVWEGLGEEVQYEGFTVRKSPAAREFAVAFYKWLSKALSSELRPVPIRLMPGGLEKVVEDGFALLGAGGVGHRQVKREKHWMRPPSVDLCNPGATCPEEKDRTPTRYTPTFTARTIAATTRSRDSEDTSEILPVPTLWPSRSSSDTASPSSTGNAQSTTPITVGHPPITTSTNESHKPNSRPIPIPAISGSMGGIIALIALGVLLLLCRRRQQRKNIYQAPIYVSPYNTDSDMTPPINSFQQRKVQQSCSEVHQPGGREIRTGLGRRIGTLSLQRIAGLPAEAVDRWRS
ncbi:hypothetical protein CC86DRAFT_452680 [Ophiobolus disseminans]|uniref:Enoyl reductase (ER) domain-containing protein n=1 Tax=Ophiobolus disseminans TaxID=1469910 RepID=A0A6A7AGB1_9PLEO|nr:hypothetical protein CC86DRAFT_452680 [Ophiobolus disseminans]